MPNDVLLVTSWDVPCGIAEHSAMLVDAVLRQSNPVGVIVAHAGIQPPTPDKILEVVKQENFRVVHLNYHAALHSLFTPEWIPIFQKAGAKVVVTYHDTGVPNSPLCKALHTAVDAMVIHEPAEDLPRAHYIRMGVQGWIEPYQTDNSRPLLGTVGFPFPWKCYDELARVTGQCGWDLLLLAPTATETDIVRWRALNPRTKVESAFLNRREVVGRLGSCDATAFTYVTHNTGQSGAILQGIAARKPVIALKTCRQFRALYDDPLGRAAIRWAETFDDVAAYLRNIRIQRVDPAIVALAHQESWTTVGRRYLEIYRSLL